MDRRLRAQDFSARSAADKLRKRIREVQARKRAFIAAKKEIDIELAKVTAASEAASADAARIAEAGAELRASSVTDDRKHRAVVARLSAPSSPIPVSGGISDVKAGENLRPPAGGSVVAAPAIAVSAAATRLPTGRVYSRGFAIHRHETPGTQAPLVSTMPPSLRAELPPSMTADIEPSFTLPASVHVDCPLASPLPSLPLRPSTTAELPPRVLAVMEREFAQMGLEAGSTVAPHGTAQRGSGSPICSVVRGPLSPRRRMSQPIARR